MSSKPLVITKKIIILLTAVFFSHVLVGQVKIMAGLVLDSTTHLPLQNVTICAQNSSHCVLSGLDGRFKISLEEKSHAIVFSATGYHSVVFNIKDTSQQEMLVLLANSYAQLEEVTVKGKKRKYRNKNNPAVELIREVIANKAKNGPGASAYSSFKQYEKTRILMDKPPRFLTKSWPLKKFGYFFDNIDSLTVPGKKLSAVYMQEVYSANYFRKQPEKKKEIVLGKKSVDYGEFVDMHGIHAALNRMYEDINIYDNNIDAFTLQFMSPIADAAPLFYMYFIKDSIEENGVKLIQLDFLPRNPTDLLFQGTLYITLDGNYAVRKLEMSVNKNSNLNWVRKIKVSQDFQKGPGDRYHLFSSDVVAFFSPFARSNGLFGERQKRITSLSEQELSDSIFQGLSSDTVRAAASQPGPFWQEVRPTPLTATELAVYSNADSLNKMRSYHRLMDWATFLAIGYKSLGIFDIGQIGNFYSFNPVEGNRVRFGGRTNTKMSNRVFLESYLAYGFKDQQWKYLVSGAWSLNHKSIYTYPFNYLQASYLHDTKNPGQEDIFAQGNAFFTSLARGYNANLLYNDIFRLSYVREFGSHLSYDLGLKYWRQQPSDSLHYLYPSILGKLDTAQQLTVTELSVALRWAPHEQFFQNKIGRRNIANKYPIFSLAYAKGMKGWAGGSFNYDAFHLDVFKRVYLSPFGFADLDFSAGYLGGNLPFPLLFIHPANQSFFYSYYAYNLMNTEEFVSDHYAGLNLDHYFGGFFFNKIPLLKKLRLREVVAAKLLFGGLRDQNNPSKNPLQMQFPVVNGALATYELNGQPYVEASVGIYNIFSVIRVDLVKRFTYLNHQNISSLGLRFSTNFTF